MITRLSIKVVLGILVLLTTFCEGNNAFSWTTNPFGDDPVFLSSGTWQFPTIHPTHPRIFITSNNLPQLRNRIDTISTISSAYKDIKDWADGETVSSIISVHINDQPPLLMKTALLALMEKQKGNTYLHYLDLSKVLINSLGTGGYNAYKSEDVRALATAYDWLYSELSLSEKQTYVQYMIEIGYRLSVQGYMKNYPHAGAPKNQLGILFAGIAFYNDGINDQMSNDIINYYGEFTEEQWMPLLTIMAGKFGGTNKSKNYFYDGAQAQLEHIEMWKTATGRNLNINNTYDQNFPYWDIYTLRPDNQNLMLYLESFLTGIRYDWVNYPLLASVFNDPLASYFASKYPKDWMYVLWYDPTIPSQSYDSLPLTRFFDGTGDVIIRTGWDIGTYSHPTANVIARFASGNWFTNKMDHHQNDFVIYYKGALIGENPRKTDKHVINHNTVMIDDEDQLAPSPYWPYAPTSAEILSQWGEDTPSDIADMLKFETTSTYDYMLGDASKAYNQSKLSLFHREFVFLRPNYFVVFDRVNTNSPTYSKKYLLHSINVPKVDGTRPPDGTTTLNASLIQLDRGGATANGYPELNGRVFSKTLLPENPKITTIFIPGRTEDTNGQLTDFEAYGRLNKEEPARWRMEIQPSTPQQNDFFLHVMQVGDSNTLLSMTTTTRIVADSMVGAFIHDSTTPQVVLFSSDHQGADVTSVTYQANYASSVNGKHLLLDMSPGVYDVYKNGNMILSDVTASSQGVLSFSSTGGSTFQVVQTGTPPPVSDTTPPSPPEVNKPVRGAKSY